MATSGTFLDLKEWACRTARFEADNASDLALAAAAVNDAYMSTCGTGDPFDFLQQEGQWITTAAADVYTYATIVTAMSITGATIAEIHKMTNDIDGNSLDSMSWEALESWSQSTQDDADGFPTCWSKWGSRLRLFPTPDAAYTLGTFVRLAPSEMTADTDTPLIPMAWRRRLLVPYAAAILLRTEGGLETAAEARGLMAAYDEDFVKFRTAYATAKKPTFRLRTPGWEANDPIGGRSNRLGGSNW